MKRVETSTSIYPKTLLVCIHAPYNTTTDIESYCAEFVKLAETNGVRNFETHFIKLRNIESGYFISKGKLEDLVEVCDRDEIEEVIFSEPLSPNQEKNLNELLHCRIFDRTQLILEIFEKGAQTAEGKIQVEMAILQHSKSRLSGQGITMSQQAGRIGERGPGETAKERALQHIEQRMTRIRRELAELVKHRETQRKRRLETGIPLLSLIGYTNAGKSTILNALTHSHVLAEDKLFATLDTTTRELFIDHKKKALISDTVGFIQQLPHKLIEAFKSTLAELQHANLLLQVIDLSSTEWETHIKVVHDVLEELDAADKPMLYVFNKVDKVQDLEKLQKALSKYQPHVLVNATTKEGLEPLIEFIRTWDPTKPIL